MHNGQRIGSAIGRGDLLGGYTALNVSQPSHSTIAHMISFVNITNELLNLAGCWPKGAERFFSHKCTPYSEYPGDHLRPGSVKRQRTDFARGFVCQTHAVIVMDVSGARFCWLCCGVIYCCGTGVAGDMARRVGDRGEPVGVSHIDVDSRNRSTRVRKPKIESHEDLRR
jgi:hypothetical protein